MHILFCCSAFGLFLLRLILLPALVFFISTNSKKTKRSVVYSVYDAFAYLSLFSVWLVYESYRTFVFLVGPVYGESMFHYFFVTIAPPSAASLSQRTVDDNVR